jgi:hypothetical protein
MRVISRAKNGSQCVPGIRIPLVRGADMPGIRAWESGAGASSRGLIPEAQGARYVCM